MNDVVQGVEQAVRTALELRKQIESLTQSYQNLGRVIEQEHQAVREADLKKLAMIVQEKVITVDTIEDAVAEIRKIALGLIRAASNKPVEGETQEPTLNAAVDALEGMLPRFISMGLAAEVFARQALQCRQGLNALMVVHKNILPKIEVNKRVVAAMQEHHRSSHRFWQSVLSEAESTYTGTGTKKGEANSSVIRIQA